LKPLEGLLFVVQSGVDLRQPDTVRPRLCAKPRSRIRVLDAGSLDERAVIELPHVIPFGFHGAWVAATR